MVRIRKRLLASIAVVGAAAITLTACSGGSGGGGNNTGPGVAPGKATDVASWALPPNVQPNWIWPFSSLANFSVNNSATFQYLMYRPLYWFGNQQGQPLVDENLSLASLPTYTNGGKTATIKLKSYKWSNGETVTAQDILFWINMEKAEKANWAAYVPGQFPDNLVSATAPDASTVVLNFDKAYSQQWLLYNQISQITPMPMAWDMTSATAKGSCATSTSGCAAVYSYLNGQSKQLSTYATSKVWGVVDGPWKLQAFNSDGNVTFVPNKTYSGPVKPTLKQFKEVPYTTDTSEYNVLRSGQTLDVGYIPTQSLTAPKPSGSNPAAAGPNPVSSMYNLAPLFLYGVNYFPLNFNSTKVGSLFKQLYVRQSLQSLVDQNGIIKAAAKGYGVPSTGPVPTYPSSPLVSSLEKSGGPYPFSISKAKSYLSDNGWKVVANGTSTCVKPGTGAGECGAGITQGEGITLALNYASGNATIDTAMADFKSNAAKVGVKINLTTAPFNTVIGNAVPTNHNWEMNNWGGGWVYSPDFYPTGELLWQTGAGSNSGAFSNSSIDKLITDTNVQSGSTVLHTYQDALAKQVPVIFQPNYTYSLSEIATALKGATPQNPFGSINPENWHY